MDTLVRTNPFPGLRPFMPEEADLFFGRDKQSDELVRRLAGRRFLAVVGTSGSGKSSLVRAGLLPSLEGGFMAEAGAHWRFAILRPQDDPIGFLARAIVESGALAKLDLAQSAAVGVVETTLRRSGLGLVEAARLARLDLHENLLIVVDQFEELFRFADLARQRGAGDEAPAFVKLLLEAARQTDVPVYVVITMRSDFLGDCARFRDLPEAISDCQYLIPRLTRDELQAVITGPIGVRGGCIAPSLVQRLLNDVGDDMDQLPVLQHALMRAWDHWERSAPDGRPIELSDLEAIGGMTQALSRHADEAFALLASERDREIAKRLFKCLTERGPDNRETRRPTQLSRIAAIANATSAEVIAVIDVFRAPGRCFLMPPLGVALEDDSVIDIAHESLIRQWGQLRTWVEEEAESRATYLRLVEAARLHRAGRAGLWGEPDLAYARQWQERNAPNAAWAERYAPGFDDAIAFLSDSEATHAAELERDRQRAEAERIAKEHELEQVKALAEVQRQRADEHAAARMQQRRANRFLLGCLAVAVATGWYGWWQQGEAKAKGRLALSRQFTMLAKDERAVDPKLAVLLAASGHRIAPVNEARVELQRALSAQLPGHDALSPGQGKLVSVDFSPDGRTLATAGEDRTVILWDVATSKPLGEPLRGHADAVSSVAFSPDGRTLASASEDRTVILWDVATSKPLGEPLRGHKDAVSSVAFSPDGKTLASASDDKSVIRWDLTDLAKPTQREVKAVASKVSRIAFSPDGKRLAASLGKDVIVWDVERDKLALKLTGHRDRVWDLAFSPDGKFLASASDDKSVILWDVERGTQQKLEGHRAPVRSLAFNANGAMLVSASSDQTVILWDVESGERMREPFEVHTDEVWDLAFSRDGKLASASLDGTVILWDMRNLNILGEPLEGHQDWIWSVAFSPDGKTLASASEDNSVILWDVASRQPLGKLEGQQGAVYSAVFSPDGKTLAAAVKDEGVVLWDVASRQPLRNLDGLRGTIYVAAFSPDGKILASAGANGTLILWDMASRKGESLEGLEGRIYVSAFSPDGKILASAGENGTVILWDVASRQRLGSLDGQQGKIYSVAFSPNGKTLASAGENGTVILWDVASRRPLGEPLKGHEHAVTSVAFSPDGKTLAAAASWGKVVILWDVASRRLLADPLRGHKDWIWGVAFSPNGKMLASASWDKTVMLWDVDVESWRRKACAIAKRNLTHKEWRYSVGQDVEYEAPCPELPMPMD